MGLTNRIQKMLNEQAKCLRIPINANLELLPVCNLNCKMCYIRTDMGYVRQQGGLISVEKWIEFARSLKEAGTLFLLLTGGEVFLYPEFKHLYIELCKMGFIITINTNATMIDEEVVEWLAQYPPKCVSISLYGSNNEVYESICGAKGMFTKVDHAIRLLLQRSIRIELKTVFTPYNIDDIENCCAYSKALNIFHETTGYSFPPARKVDKNETGRFSPEEAADCRFACNRFLSDEQVYKEQIIGHLQKYEDTRYQPGGSVQGFTCGATRSSFWITWQGHMTPCAMLEEPYTLPFEQGFSAAWEELKEKCDRILMSPKCSHCDKRAVCTVCPAACYAETGSFEKHSPYHCRMTEYTLESMERQVKEWGIEDRIVRRNEEK